MESTRRQLLARLGIASLSLLAVRAGAEGTAPACYDPATLPLSQRNRRRSLAYTDVSADPKQRCGLCAFFAGTGDASCGTCQILTGGAVSANGVCTSFAARSS